MNINKVPVKKRRKVNKESLEIGGNFKVRTKREKCLIMGSRGVPAKPTNTKQSTLDAALNKNAKKVTFQDVPNGHTILETFM